MAISMDDFPPHIQKLLVQMREKEESDRIAKEKENDMFKLKVYCHHPIKNRLEDTKIVVFFDSMLAEAREDALIRFKLLGVVDREDCRIVSYNKAQDVIDCSFEDHYPRFCELLPKLNLPHNDWLLEIKAPGKFQG